MVWVMEMELGYSPKAADALTAKPSLQCWEFILFGVLFSASTDLPAVLLIPVAGWFGGFHFSAFFPMDRDLHHWPPKHWHHEHLRSCSWLSWDFFE